jgi:hypothetical protein
MVEAAAQLDYPTSRGEVVQWFAEHYPQVKASTIRAHIVGLTANDRSRHHYPSLARPTPYSPAIWMDRSERLKGSTKTWRTMRRTWTWQPKGASPIG